MRTILVTGATGFIGAALVERLIARGDRVLVFTRDARRARALFGERVHCVEDLAALPAGTRIDAVVNLAGAPVVGLPWSAARRREIWRSRVEFTNALVRWIATLDHKPGVLVSASAVGFYGNRGDAILNEAQTAGQGFGAALCKAWEDAAQGAGIRTVCLRIGVVLDRSGGPLSMMTWPMHLGLGATLGSGAQWTSWIARDDLLRMFVAAIDDQRWQGAVNAVGPEPARHADLQLALARTLRRPMLFRVPAFVLRAFLGEMSSVFLYSQRVVPAKAQALGFSFDVWWISDVLALQLSPAPSGEQGLPSPAPAVDTAPQSAITPGDEHEYHPSRRSLVPLRAQGTRGSGRKRARL